MKNKVLQFTEDHAAEILIGVGITSMVSSTILTFRQAPKINDMISNRMEELDIEKLPPVELVKAVWKPVLPIVLTGGFGIGCIIASNRVSNGRNAMLAAACSASEKALRTYAAKTLEVVGEEKEREIREVIGRKKIQDDPLTSAESQILMIGEGEVLCYDGVSGRYFKSSLEKLQAAMNDLNRQIIDDSFASLNDYYYFIGLDSVRIGDTVGWNYEDGKIEFLFSSILSSDGRPCLVVEPALHPEHSYKESYR